MTCPLCAGDGGLVVARTSRFRVVRVADGEEARRFPAFYRLIWTDHVAEFSDLPVTDRHACMDAVAEIERVLRSLLAPTKINLATLGNVVPHLHWHVIARFDWDSHFPAPVWASPQRDDPSGGAVARIALPLKDLDAAIAEAISR
ncbi:MAG: HIT family protein [Rubrivivax sp.]|nr:MAG: HIT family protein [Rubrivivax sp.]